MAKFTANGINARIQHRDGESALPVAVTLLTGANPATLKVGHPDIGKFNVGDTVVLASPPGTAASATGPQEITAINYSTDVITFGDLNGSGWTGGPFTNPANMTITPTSNETEVAVTGISNAKPAVVTVASGDAPLFVEGNVVSMSNTGVPALDGKAFLIGTVAGSTFQLLGSDTRSNGTSITTGIAAPVDPSDMLLFCLTSWEREVKAEDPIDVTTFCGPGSIAATPQPGTVTIEGFVDFDEAAMNEWRTAVSDGLTRVCTLEMPSKAGGGTIVFSLTPSGFTETFEVNEAASFQGEATIMSEPVYLVGADAPT